MTSTVFDTFQDVVLNQLLCNDQYLRTALPFIKESYFEDNVRGTIAKHIFDYIETYTAPPNESALSISLQESTLTTTGYNEAQAHLKRLFSETESNWEYDWLVDKTELWCRKRAFYNAMVEGSELLSKKQEDFYATDLPTKMEQALAISFDTTIGMDFLEDYQRKYDYIHEESERFPFDLDLMNKITKQGLPKKSLTVLMSTTTGGFKTGSMCHFTSNWISQGKNVLYISMEMSEEMISQRIDANLMDVELDYIEELPYALYRDKSVKLQDTIPGRLIIKEYPTGTAHAGHFRFLLKELAQKKGFKPDIICVDYLNICASSRLPASAMASTFTYVKAIAEELRALAVEFDVAMVSGTQGNRDAADSSDISIANVSESIGLPSTVDILLGIIFTEEMDERNEIMFKQLKNRFGDINKHRRIVVGVEKAKMRLFNLGTQAQQAYSTKPDAAGFQTEPRSKKSFDDFEFD